MSANPCANDIVTRNLKEKVQTAEKALGKSIRVVEHSLSIQQRAGRFTNLLPFLEGALGFIDANSTAIWVRTSTLKRAANMHSTILELNQGHGVEAGLTASYCWNSSQNTRKGKTSSILIDGGNFQIRWNKQGGAGNNTWMTDPTRNERAGFPPEVQGQELHHVGLIIGPDVSIIDDKLEFFPENHVIESPIFGRMKDKEKAIATDREKYVRLLRNQYWVLMTRGMRSLHIYSEDPEVREFFSKHATRG